MAFQSPTAFIQRRSLLAAFESSEALPSETILLKRCARRTRASPKIEKCAESGAMPENLAKARSVIKAGVSRSRVCAVH